MNFSNLNSGVRAFNLDFFKKLDHNETDLDKYINLISSKHSISNKDEIKALMIYYFWNYYFLKLFPNIIERKINNDSDPRSSYLYKYCYKLQKETNGILDEKDYKDYVYCQLKFLKNYREKSNKTIMVTPSILNVDKGWRKWKYFKYLMSKKNQSIDKKTQYVNNDNLKIFLLDDKKFLENKIGKVTSDNIVKNINNIIFWNKIGGVSNYFLAMCGHIDKSKLSKDLSVYNFDSNAIKLFNTIFSL